MLKHDTVGLVWEIYDNKTIKTTSIHNWGGGGGKNFASGKELGQAVHKLKKKKIRYVTQLKQTHYPHPKVTLPK